MTITIDLSLYKDQKTITVPTKLLKPRCKYKDEKIRCRKLGVYGINGVYYCYKHKRQLEAEHLTRIGY